jgi:molybdopterin molybdotransferase
MISVVEAHEIVRSQAKSLPAERVSLGDLLGLRLAEDVASRVDSPPFDKSQVDGFAIATGDEAPELRVVEMVTAGHVPQLEVTPGATIRVMTGAPLPRGADAVVKWEDCEQTGDATIVNPRKMAKPGSCVLRRGAAFHEGEVVLRAGKILGPLDVALLAEIGQADVAVTPRPRVGVLPTGDELVAAHEACGPGQIRNSNGPMLLAALQAAGATAVDLGVARDTPEDLREKIERGLECDVLLISGGVSAGVKDLVPGVLAELGVAEHFHKVRMKPGKPLWFGTREAEGRTTLVFGLPGNPVSTYVSFKLFVEPALKALIGGEYDVQAHGAAYPITAPFQHRGGRPTYHPALMVMSAGDRFPSLQLLDWKGSADLATLTRAEFLAVLPAGDYELSTGDEVEAIWLGWGAGLPR